MAGRRGDRSFELSDHSSKGAVMEGSVTRPAVDVAADKPRPGLALLLAVLAVPGSTIAFDLPGGGFYIGLPLAVAAIVLGVRARRQLGGSRQAVAAFVIAGLCIAQMAIWTLVSVVS
jgi:hypothetical protein